MIDPLKRGLPSDAVTEALVLGALISDPDAWHECAETLTAECFTVESHRRIYSAMAALASRDEALDRVTVATELGDDLPKVGGMTRLATLDDGLPRVHNVAAYAQTLAGIARRREALSLTFRLYEAIERADGESAVLGLDNLTTAISAPTDRPEWLDPEQVVNSVGGIDMLLCGGPTLRDAIRPPAQWPKFSALAEAFLPGELVVIGARPGVGKTIWLTNVMEAACDQARVCRMASLEMLAPDIITRMACARGKISLGRIIHGHATDEEKRAFATAYGQLAAMQLKIRDASQFTVAALSASVRREGGRVKAVFVDYLGLMDAQGRTPYERMIHITRGLKRLALEQRLVVFAAAQLNRQAPSESRPPRLDDLRDAGSIEQDADRVFLLHELTETMDEGSRRVDCIVAKQRRGRLGTVPMWRIGRISRLEEA